MELIQSGYVCAGFESVSSMIDRFMKGKSQSGFYDNHFTRKDVNNFFKSTCSGFLHSYGQSFTGKKYFAKYNKGIEKQLTKARETGFFDDCTFICDSGGFQASIGKIDKEEVEMLIREYHNFLREYHHCIDKAFVLDLPPGPLCKLFDTWNDVYQYNRRTYNMARELPTEIRDKMAYIHHFRTPRSWETFNKIMREDDMFNDFKYHATGGLVARLSGDMVNPIALYVLPIVPLLNECKKFNRDFLNFHILGGANYRDILFYELFHLHVKKVHHIDLNITYDSSAIFKSLIVARIMNVFEDDVNLKLNIRNEYLDKRVYGSKKNQTVYEKLVEILEEVANIYNFKVLNVPESFYDPNTGTFPDDVKTYLMFYTLHAYSIAQTVLRDTAKRIYPLYENGMLAEFNKEVAIAVQKLNNGKITKKSKSKSTIGANSLDVLTNLDEGYCKYFIDKFLAKDEITNLDSHGKILTF